MGTDRTPQMMTKLSEFFGGLDLHEGVNYRSGPKYTPHMYFTDYGELNRQVLRGWLVRGWVMDVRSGDKTGPIGTIYLTDEERDIVQAF